MRGSALPRAVRSPRMRRMTNHATKVELRETPPCEFGEPGDLPAIPAAEYERRLRATYDACAGDGGGWVVVYADREHYANLTWLINFDPRFEEALLVLGRGGKRALILGNEGFGYTSVLPVPVDTVLAQSLSLPGQKRETAPWLDAVLRDLGLKSGDRVAVDGWKYLEAEEGDDVRRPAYVPAHHVDALRRVVGEGAAIEDRTDRVMNPRDGLRAINSAEQIAAFEWGA